MLTPPEENIEISTFKEKIFRIEKQIENATSKLFHLDSILKSICEEIQDELDFDFATIQLIRPDERIIETVCGTGIAAGWRGRARHYLEPDRDLGDIQADVAQTCRTEIIAGWDEENRFDKSVYKEYGHAQFVRIFTPLILLQDDQGQNNKNWFEDFEYRLAKNELNQEINQVNQEWFTHPERHKSKDNGQHVAIELLLPKFYSEDNAFIVEVIGTIEVGYEKAHEHGKIRIEKAIELIRFAGEKTLEIRQAQLPYVLETIANNAMEMVSANGTSLHFMRHENQNFYANKIESDGSIKLSLSKIKKDQIPYVYEVFSGLIGRNFLKTCPPRKEGLGSMAIKANKPRFIPDYSQGHGDNALATFNPPAYEAGIRAMIALPLIFESQQGVLYIHFNRKHQFEKREIQGLEFFANRALDAIWHTFAYEHQQSRNNQLITLHKVAQSIASMPDEEKLLNYIAWNTINILAADTVTIYRYLESEKRFPPLPVMAGRFRDTKKAQQEVDKHDVLVKLVRYGKNLYPSDEGFDDVFRDSSFAERENIKATAGILLKVSKQVVGTMFINYRRSHKFSDEEKQIIETLASSAAIAIKNQRWLSALHEIDRKIITTLDRKEVLDLIKKKAVQMTGADLADIRLLDPISEELIMEVWHPANALNVSSIYLKLGEGITGWVAQHRKPLMINDVQNDSRYITFFENVGSELCVPLLDNHRILGVLNLESYQTDAFEERHLRMMETLAGQAVIAIQNIENKEQSTATAKIATLGDFVGQLIHRVNSDLGAIQFWTQKIIKKGDEDSKSLGIKIQSKGNELLEEVEHLQDLLDEETQYLNLYTILDKAIAKACLPTNINYELKVVGNILTILAGKQQLIYIFCNLIENAKAAMPNGGKLSINCRNVDLEENRWVVIEVSDTGEGIRPEYKEKIFRLGYSTKPGHKGFGLWWSWTYIKRLGGMLKVQENSVGQGTKFIVALPIERTVE